MLVPLLMLAVMAMVVAALNPPRQDFRWFLQLRRPTWLSFEQWIPPIWIAIYACFYGSALLSWKASGSLALMAGYLLLLILVQSYSWVICRTRNLRNGTIVGFAGWVWGVALAIAVAPVNTSHF